MATLRPVSNCSQCGAETRLFRADGPYCLACVDRLGPSPTWMTAHDESVQLTERYLGCTQRIAAAVNDKIGIEPAS